MLACRKLFFYYILLLFKYSSILTGSSFVRFYSETTNVTKIEIELEPDFKFYLDFKQ